MYSYLSISSQLAYESSKVILCFMLNQILAGLDMIQGLSIVLNNIGTLSFYTIARLISVQWISHPNPQYVEIAHSDRNSACLFICHSGFIVLPQPLRFFSLCFFHLLYADLVMDSIFIVLLLQFLLHEESLQIPHKGQG